MKYLGKYGYAIFIAGLLWFLDHIVNPDGVFEVDLVGRALGFTDGAILGPLLTLPSSIPEGTVARWGRKPLEALGSSAYRLPYWASRTSSSSPTTRPPSWYR